MTGETEFLGLTEDFREVWRVGDRVLYENPTLFPEQFHAYKKKLDQMKPTPPPTPGKKGRPKAARRK